MTDRKITRVLSLGAGIQSSCLLLMSCRGILPKLDYAVFADTGWEPKAVYDQLEFLKGEAAKAGIEVVKISAGNLREDIFTKAGKERIASLPVYTKGDKKTEGRLGRQCSAEYKIAPIKKWMREIVLGLRPRQRAPQECAIELWFGISLDEVGRAKPYPHLWCKAAFPLLNWPEMGLEKPWRRQDCAEWLSDNYPDRIWVRSSCVGCPHHGAEEWLEIKKNKEEWKDAVDADATLRHSGGSMGKVNDEIYLHRSCVPLDQVDLTLDDPNQTDWIEECGGHCGL